MGKKILLALLTLGNTMVNANEIVYLIGAEEELN